MPLTPSELLRLKSDNLQAIQVLSAQFAGRIVDVSEHSVIVEMCGKTKRVEAFLSLLKPFGVLESARTGAFVSLSLSLEQMLKQSDRSYGHASHTVQAH